MGDKIGMLLEFNNRTLSVRYFINKIDMGLAFKDLPANTYFPCALLLYEGAKIKISNKMCVPDIKN